MNELYLSTATAAATAAGKLLMQSMPAPVHHDQFDQPTTEQDVASEMLIIKMLGEAFPEHGLLGEELGAKNQQAEYTWIIDPIDGTNNYVDGRDTFSVSIGLAHHGEIILGVVYLPRRNELFSATAGHGAFLTVDYETVDYETPLIN
ncbi:hypothetical protein HY933_00725 [Candidatus Falkowbacteria bacterium]|nr:hypothetical protein [Candidatus Falkowbacteria bacterium]